MREPGSELFRSQFVSGLRHKPWVYLREPYSQHFRMGFAGAFCVSRVVKINTHEPHSEIFRMGLPPANPILQFSEPGSRVTKTREPGVLKTREPHSENFRMGFAGKVHGWYKCVNPIRKIAEWNSLMVKPRGPHSENFRMRFAGGKTREPHSENFRMRFTGDKNA